LSAESGTRIGENFRFASVSPKNPCMPSVLEHACCAVIVLSLGCASRAAAQPRSHSSPDSPRGSAPSTSTAPGNVGSVAPKSEPKPPEAKQEPGALPPSEPGAGAVPQSLPELKVQLSGLHIGGGPNDAVTKRPFIEVLESGFEPMRACYSHVEEPGKGGTFGVDLRVERNGGHPTVQSVRTAIKGDKFRTCVEQAFLALNFARPKKPTVLSASVRFTLAP
jgi:hypothetical protein